MKFRRTKLEVFQFVGIYDGSGEYTNLFCCLNRWKTKCRKQEKEIDRLKESIDQINTKNEEILKENIAGKTQTNNGTTKKHKNISNLLLVFDSMHVNEKLELIQSELALLFTIETVQEISLGFWTNCRIRVKFPLD